MLRRLSIDGIRLRTHSRCARFATSATSAGSLPQVLMMPGQGAQRTGMCKDLAAEFTEARLVLEEVDEALKFKLSKLMFEGPEAELSRTAYTQPALLAHSLAVLRVIQARAPEALSAVTCVAGHSVGEYPALVAAGAMSVAHAAAALHARGRAMQAAADAAAAAGDGGGGGLTMRALLLAPPASPATAPTSPSAATAAGTDAGHNAAAQLLAQVCDEVSGRLKLVAAVAAVNSPSQVVLSGHAAAVEAVLTTLKSSSDSSAAKMVRRAVALPVSAPFHCPIMAPAAAALQELLYPLLPPSTTASAAQPQQPEQKQQTGSYAVGPQLRYPLISNVSAQPEREPGRVVQLLLQGVTSTVQWQRCVHAAAAHARSSSTARTQTPGNTPAAAVQFLELGPGSTLSALVKQCLPPPAAAAAAAAASSLGTAAACTSLGTAAEVVSYLRTLEASLK